MIVDYHVHSPYCGHARGTMVEYVEAAITAGVTEMCFADHLGRYYLGRPQRKRYWDWGMSDHMLERYVAEALELKKVYAGRISIRVGLEIDYIEGAEHLVAKYVNRFPFDFLLGSIHCLPQLGWLHIAQYPQADPDSVYEWYFKAAEAAVESGLFQSIAHIDFLWRYVAWPHARKQELAARIARFAAKAKRNMCAVEINANGFIWSQANYSGAYNPFDILVDTLRSKNVPVSIGSDAHAPQLVAKFFPAIFKLLKKKGIVECCVFSRQKPSVVSLG